MPEMLCVMSLCHWQDIMQIASSKTVVAIQLTGVEISACLDTLVEP